MKFFTDNSIQWPYLLTKITKYLKMREETKKKYKEILIDPGVYDLIKSNKYSWEDKIDIKEFLLSLPPNHYFSWDYPSDMNLLYENEFIEKSWENAEKFVLYPQYIVTVQAKFNNYWDFKNRFDKYNELNITSGILGLGNMCKHPRLNQFMKHALDYAFSHCYHRRIHIYGLCKDAIPYAYRKAIYYGIEFSIDQEKWQYYKPSSERPFWFSEYIKAIKLKGVKVEA